MEESQQAIEEGLARYEELLGEDPELEREFADTRRHFASGGGKEDVMAARRHLEWFVLERPSDTLGGVPAERLHEAWSERADEAQRDLAEAFLHSRAGAFEITSQDTDRGLWVLDLFGQGEFPITEPEAAAALQKGDLLVGRIFPVGEGLFRLSPAVSVFRDARLLEAVREDLSRMRGQRRGVLRIQQVELERLFFRPGSTEAPDRAATRRATEEELAAIGLEPGLARSLVERISDATGDPNVVTDVMNELAFDTDVDLERARRSLLALWTAARQGSPGSSESPESRADTDANVASAQDGDARAALDAFDRGRAEGRDLDELFRELADELGVEAPVDDDEASGPPDFPGVVGAMIEEFRWEVGREQGAAAVERLDGLEHLARWGADLGVFENLGPRDLLDFAGRWLLDQGHLADGREARTVLDALASFCQWCEEQHAHPLWTGFETLWQQLSASVPRLVEARRHMEPRTPDVRPCDVLAVGENEVVLRDDAGDELRGALPEGLRSLIVAGDLVHAARDDQGILHLATCYPGELRELIRRGA